MSTRSDTWDRRLPLLLYAADVLILYVAFVGAMKARFGSWTPMLHELGLGTGLLVSMIVYSIALFASGLYRTHPRTMHLGAFLRVGVSVLVAWPISITLAYLLDPTEMPPRSVSAVHCLLSLVGILGLRAAIRQVYEWTRPAAPAETALPAEARLPARPGGLIEDLLPREPFQIDARALRDHLSSRTVLVTGAGGSIGSELSRQLARLSPFRLVLVDVSEYNLFQIEQVLRREPFEGELVFRIADVRDEELMRTLFADYRPDVVLHAAAYKHVPLMERHPVEAFRNNTMVTVGLVHLCEAFDTEQFVFISTDKAVAPTSVLGATKRLAEWYVRAANAPMRCKTVRFGNVFGSQGSVVPVFLEQIAGGGPVTLTHPDMERYFMSADEACRLILQTLLLDAAPVYTLKMGEPVRIQWLAEQLIARLQPPGAPSIAIAYTGVRPGEKLQEQLWEDAETPVPTAHPAILGLQSAASYSRAELDAYLADLGTLCAENRPEELRKALFQTRLRSPARR